MARAPPKEPLIAIIGATGTGKSQLAVELAKRYNGEVINGDAMQLYAGLPIITNKITTEEQQGIPHHLLGCIGLHEQTWVVGTFVKKALGVIQEIRSRGNLPILVGGTHYYLQSLLFRDRLAEGESEQETPFVKDTAEQWPILQADTAMLLEELKRVDPVMAERWHPNDRRKIQRSLEIYVQTGRKASDIYAEQRGGSNGDCKEEGLDPSLTSSMRFPTLLFWIHAEAETLNARLAQRVNKMLQTGLLSEVHELESFANMEAAQGRPVDETRGIWVSIGYKELKPYIKALNTGAAAARELAQLQAAGLERTNIATRQYAKRQVRWIRIKLANALREAEAGDSLYLLDGSDVSHFEEQVIGPAASITQSFLCSEQPLPDPKSLSAAAAEMLTAKRDYDLSSRQEQWQKQHCELCNVTCVTPDQWAMHTKSKAHRKLVSKRRKAEAEAAQDGEPFS